MEYQVGDLVEINDADLLIKPFVGLITEVLESTNGCYRVLVFEDNRERIYFQHEMKLISE